MSEIYLKIYIENNDTIVFEGQGEEDKQGYYPTRWDNDTQRFGTVAVGAKHITITKDAKDAFKRIIKNAKKTNDDISCLSIHNCFGKNPDGSMKDVCDEVAVAYIGDIVTKWDIECVINDEQFFIGTGEGLPDISLLDKLIQVD